MAAHVQGARLGAAVRLAQPTTSGRLLAPAAASLTRRTPRHGLQCLAIAYGERPTVAVQPRSSDVSGDEEGPSLPTEDREMTEKERIRRLRISAANKGRIPWNKGKAMPAETREKIRQKTYEAMQRPDVRARMAEANQHRSPHLDSTKEKIKTVLRERVTRVKALIAEESDLILADMRLSSVEKERAAAEREDVREILSRTYWRFAKREFQDMHARWQRNENGFRDAVLARIDSLQERIERKRSVDSSRRRASSSPIAKVRRAKATQRKLVAANKKLSEAEMALEQIEPIRPRMDSIPGLKEKVVRIEEMVGKLRSQVEALNEAMAPLQEYLNPSASNATGFLMQQQELAAAAAAAAEAADGGNGPPAEGAAATLSSPPQEQQQQQDEQQHVAPHHHLPGVNGVAVNGIVRKVNGVAVNGIVRKVNGVSNGVSQLNGSSPVNGAVASSSVPWR